jgi:hypothetical protein
MKHLQTYDAFILESMGGTEYRPLSKILECKFTPDRKHLVLDGIFYSSETGEIVPLNEWWSLSDILHAGADVLSAVVDFVIPGSGAIIDALNALSYVIEAQFASADKKDSLYLMAAITFAFVILPGPLQAVSIPLKRFIKSGAKAASPLIKKALGIVASILPKILTDLPNLINSALKSKLASAILGKYAGKIGAAIKQFGASVLKTFNKAMGLPDMAKTAGKNILAKTAVKTVLDSAAIGMLKKFFSSKVKVKLAKETSEKALKKLGFVPGKAYRYINKSGKGVTAKIVGSGVDGKTVLVKFGNKAGLSPTSVPVSTFVRQTIGAPWGRRGYTVAAPLLVKQFASMMNSAGEIDPALIEQIPPLDPELVSKETMAYYLDEVPEYDGAGETVEY